ncbi:response regulator receiver protein [Niabella ginsenosidivorans]|uniref:Response regulator receiver protein n=1 Tax=Niabella ginsenosidivorans TaxID=1176587 RepID=A0A1A9HZA3_9BACT|nr:response regulator [Niabella ginsenosidivorans]ANH79801.1 response regulator receiver protein [Niabella ginsenosidivorans]
MKTGKEIFIVDDDSIHRLLMSKLFARQNKGYKLDFFENGQKAMDVLETAIADNPSGIPDIILLDIEMPVMNGWQFMNKYRLLPPEIKDRISVYMVSSSFSDEDQERVKSYPEIVDYIVKPLRIEKIIELMN